MNIPNVSIELVGLVVALAGGIWWASSINSKMDTIIGILSGQTNRMDDLEKRVSKHDVRLAVIEDKNEGG